MLWCRSSPGVCRRPSTNNQQPTINNQQPYHTPAPAWYGAGIQKGTWWAGRHDHAGWHLWNPQAATDASLCGLLPHLPLLEQLELWGAGNAGGSVAGNEGFER